MATRYENAKGVYFRTSHKVTAVYQIVEERYAGESEVKYLVSTGKNIKCWFSDMGAAFNEAIRRQAWIDAKN